jgi:hypothetical protein
MVPVGLVPLGGMAKPLSHRNIFHGDFGIFLDHHLIVYNNHIVYNKHIFYNKLIV